MPAKHVHFPYASSSDGTPSPSYSTSTLPSSTGPITPPALGFGSPYYNTPLPGIETQLHSCLRVNAGQVAFDVSLPVSNIKTPSYVSQDALAAPASNPPVPFMTVTCARLPWTITIVPRSQISSFVTIRDVFETLYVALRMPVTAAEYAQLPNAVAQDTVNRAFRMRCSRDGGSELKKGLKRIDFLGLQTKFCGLKPVKHGLGGWILEVS